MYLRTYLICILLIFLYLEFDLSPTTVILYLGDTSAVFACQLSDGITPLWEVNGVRYTLDGLSNGDLSGHGVSGANVTVSVPVNGTKYVCIIPVTPVISSDPAFLYIAGELYKIIIQNTYVHTHIYTEAATNI